MHLGPGSLTFTNWTLERLVEWAYRLHDFQIAGAPGWFRSERYDLVAKAYGAPDIAHLQLLLQALLTDRLKLSAHRETRELPVFALTVDTRGLKMKRSVGTAPTDAPQLLGRNGAAGAQLAGQHATMAQLTANLSGRLARPVIDKTGLTGEFDFRLEWTPDENQLARTMPPGAPPSGPGDSSGLSIFTALKEQLGLRLESRKGAVNVLVIDSANRIPTDN